MEVHVHYTTISTMRRPAKLLKINRNFFYQELSTEHMTTTEN